MLHAETDLGMHDSGSHSPYQQPRRREHPLDCQCRGENRHGAKPKSKGRIPRPARHGLADRLEQILGEGGVVAVDHVEIPVADVLTDAEILEHLRLGGVTPRVHGVEEGGGVIGPGRSNVRATGVHTRKSLQIVQNSIHSD